MEKMSAAEVNIMKKGILLDNAYCSWANAIYYCKLIKVGRATLSNKKLFVSAFHNAVELFLKQLMLDENDHRVAFVKRVDKNGEPAKRFFEAQNLNDFFSQLGKDQMQHFFSIEFSKLLDVFRGELKAFDESKGVLLDGLKRLNDLRNNETHFLINSSSFLDDAEFVLLFNTMDTFNWFLNEKELLPSGTYSTGENKRLFFPSDILMDFTYVNAIRQSDFVKKLILCASGMEVSFLDGPYEIALKIAKEVDQSFSECFDELWEYLEVMDDLGLYNFDVSSEKLDEKNSIITALYLKFE